MIKQYKKLHFTESFLEAKYQCVGLQDSQCGAVLEKKETINHTTSLVSYNLHRNLNADH